MKRHLLRHFGKNISIILRLLIQLDAYLLFNIIAIDTKDVNSEDFKAEEIDCRPQYG